MSDETMVEPGQSASTSLVTRSGLFFWVPTLHLALSAALAACSAALVFLLWFPAPFRDLAGGTQLFWILVGVDVVCGPLLTWVLFKPGKTRLALAVDLTLIATIQLSALVYGLHTVSYARPIAIVFEVDRFHAVSFADLAESYMDGAPDWVRPWGLSGIRVVGARSAATTLKEKLASLEASLQGVEISQRPSWWQDYALNLPQVRARALPLADLRQKHPTRQEVLDNAVGLALQDVEPGETTDGTALLWLPLVSRRSMSWVVLLDPQTTRVRGFVALDGF